MQKISSLKYLLAALVLAAAVLAAAKVVLASDNSPLSTPSDPEQSTTLPQRLAQREATFKVQLSAAQQQTIKSKCTVAQTGLQDIKTKDIAAASDRQQVYDDLATQLANIVDHLKRQNVDTTQLAAAQGQFNGAINTYLTDAVTYKTAMDDTVVMDCVSDPLGFEASLLSARQLREQLASDVAKIKATRPALTKALNDAQQVLIKNNASGQKAAQ